jgi:hypothetical protein
MSLGAEIKARMTLDTSGVKAGVQNAKGEVGSFSASLKGMAGTLGIAFGAGAAVSGITNFTRATVEMVSRSKDMAEQAALTTEQFQAFKAVAMQVTGGLKAAEIGLVAFRAAQDEALNGNKPMIEAFKRLGISIEDVARLSTPQLLEAVAKGYKSIGDFGALVDIFGKNNAAKLEDALNSLAINGFKKLADEGRAAGLVLSGEVAAQIDGVGDAMDRTEVKAKNFWARLWIGAKNLFDKQSAVMEGYGPQPFGPEMGQMPMLPEQIERAKADPIKELAAKTKALADDKAREDKKTEERDAKLRADKLKAIQEAAEAEKKAAEDVAAKKKAAEEAAAKKAADELAKKRAEEEAAVKAASEEAGKVSLTELRGAETRQFQQRFDSLRQIGANVLGSGVIRPAAVDYNAEIARTSRATADNTARLVQKIDAQPVARLAASTAVF